MTKAERKQLASLINDLEVWGHIAGSDSRASTADKGVAAKAYKDTTIELFEKFGIELPNTQRFLNQRAEA